MQSKYSLLDKFQIFVVLVLFGFKLIPQFQYAYTGIFWSIAYQGIFLGWLFLTILKSGFWIRYLKSYLKNWFLWIVFLLIVFILFPNTQLGFLSLNLTFWEPMLIYFYYTQIESNSKTTSLISWICILFLLYGLLQSIKSVNVNELAAREASSGHSSEDAILTGNYSFTATLSILLPAMYVIIISKVKITWKILAFAMIGMSFYFVIHCNLMISILCMLLSIPAMFVFGSGSSINIKRMFIGLFLFMFIVLTLSFWKNLLIGLFSIIGDIVDSKEIDKKVLQLIELMNGNLIGNIQSRFGLCLIAIKTFFENPIFGIGPQNNANIYFLSQLGLHATLFDDFARYGIVGMAIMLKVYREWIKWNISMFTNSNNAVAFKASILVYVIISMLNPTISANIGIALFFLLPSLLYFIVDKENQFKEDHGIYGG